MRENVIEYSNELCFSLEKDYSKDHDIISILESGKTIDTLIKSSLAIQKKEASRLVKFPVVMNTEVEEQYNSIDDLPFIVEMLCGRASFEIILECMDRMNDKNIMFKVEGAFSRLLFAVGSNVLFKWLRKYENKVLDALEKINNSTIDYIIEAINAGTKIISYAEPSGMPELIGEKLYRKFVADFTIRLLKKLELYLCGSIVHICPRTSIMLEKYGYLTSKTYFFDIKNYAENLLSISQYNEIKFIGHRCINAENTKNGHIYKLSLN